MANVFYLDVDDEITSAAARIRASKEPRVGLVVPPSSRIATSRINFRLLAREALERNRALSIVSSDPAARALAASAGLPAFATVAEFEADQGPATAVVAGAAAAGVASPVPPSPAAAKSSTGAKASRSSSAAGPARAPDLPPPAAVVADARIGARSSGASAPAVRPAGPKGRSPVRVAAGAVAVLVMVLVLGLIAAFFLPSATITITPKIEAVTPIELSIRADPNATASDPVAGVVPATILTMDFTSSGTFNATGKKTTTTNATGSVTFTSINTVTSVDFPSGSIVSTADGVTFATTQDLTLPRAHFGHSASSGSVGVKAVKGGLSGNVPAGAVDQLPPGYATYLYTVTNPSATTGGTSTTTTQVQKADTDAAMAGLTKDLKSQFTAWLAAPTGLAAGSTAFPKTGVLGVITPDNDPTALIGTVQPTFELTLTASGTVTAVDQSAVATLATTRLQTTVTSDYSLVAGSTKVTIGTPRADSDAVVFPVTATASQIRHLDPDTLRGLVAGKSVDEAQAILAPYGTVDIKTWPGFVNSVPSLAWRLTLTVEGGAADASSPPSAGPLESVPPSTTAPSLAPSVAPSVGPSSLIMRGSRAA